MRERLRSARGQSLVEFAVFLPVLLLIFLGVFDLGRVYNTYIVITNAARDGAYYGSMHSTDTSGIVQRVVTEAQGSAVNLTSSNVTVSTSGGIGNPLRVTVQLDFSMLSTFLLGRRTIHLTSRTEMMIVR
jgi:Flp pilus assembly protein TadG